MHYSISRLRMCLEQQQSKDTQNRLIIIIITIDISKKALKESLWGKAERPFTRLAESCPVFPLFSFYSLASPKLGSSPTNIFLFSA